MRKKTRSFVAKLFCFILCLTMVAGMAVSASASGGISTDTTWTTLMEYIMSGKYSYNGNVVKNISGNTYKLSGGGYLIYTEITDNLNASGNYGKLTTDKQFFDTTQFNKLTSGQKQEFLKDIVDLATIIATDGEKSDFTYHKITTDTVNDMYSVISNKAGMGASFIATLTSGTKPNFAAANKILAPFSSPVSTFLGVMAIGIMTLLGVVMALDIAYIVIPPFQLFIGGSGSGDEKKGLSKIISQEARMAVKATGNEDSKDYKAAIGVYFKYRWLSLTILAICLMYLVNNQIYSFIAWFIDLFSGFLGF